MVVIQKYDPAAFLQRDVVKFMYLIHKFTRMLLDNQLINIKWR